MALMDFYQHSRSGVSSSSSFRGTVALLCNYLPHNFPQKSKKKERVILYCSRAVRTPHLDVAEFFKLPFALWHFRHCAAVLWSMQMSCTRVLYALPPRRPSFLRSTTLIAGALPCTHERSPYTPSKTLMAGLWPVARVGDII